MQARRLSYSETFSHVLHRLTFYPPKRLIDGLLTDTAGDRCAIGVAVPGYGETLCESPGCHCLGYHDLEYRVCLDFRAVCDIEAYNDGIGPQFTPEERYARTVAWLQGYCAALSE